MSFTRTTPSAIRDNLRKSEHDLSMATSLKLTELQAEIQSLKERVQALEGKE